MPINQHNIREIADFYDAKFDQFGCDVKSVGWGDRNSQELRFKVLSEVGDLTGASVCDVGCGFGELFPYLEKRFNGIQYTGIDISEKLLSQAKRLMPGINFLHKNILEQPLHQEYDFILSSGALTYKINSHEKYVKQMLGVMFEGCRKGIAVNFLSTHVDFQLEKNFHCSPEMAFAWAKRLTRYVSLRHDYPLYEFTLYLYRESSYVTK